MPTPFADHFQKSYAHLLDASFGETVEYVSSEGASARTIEAIVNRTPGQVVNFSGQIVSYKILIDVHNNAVTGISSAELDQGTAWIRVARRVDGPLEDIPVAQLINAEGGVTKLAVV